MSNTIAFFRDPITNRDTATHIITEAGGLACPARMGSGKVRHRVYGAPNVGNVTCARCRLLWAQYFGPIQPTK